MINKPTKTKKPAQGQTGPTTPTGKATSSRNATKTGLHASGWIDQHEELEYQDLFHNLCIEYNAKSTTLLLQIERMASTMVKMRRLQKIETALFQKARGLAEIRAKEKQSIPSLSSSDPEQALLIAQLAAMPDMDRLATLQRYQTSLDRQLSKVIGEIRVLTMNVTNTLEALTTEDRSNILGTKTMEKNSNGSSSEITALSK
jgi:hypothetical protein